VKEAAVEKKVSGIAVISQKGDGIFAVAAVVYGHFWAGGSQVSARQM
jgi:hypothetical protein